MYTHFKSFEESLCFPMGGQAEQEECVGWKLRQGSHILAHGTLL